MKTMLHQLLLILLLVGITGGTPLRAAPPEQWRAVDQAVADLDPLATSLRAVEPGRRYGGQPFGLFVAVPTPHAASYERDGVNPVIPSTPVYYRIAPGLRARVGRIEYLVRTGTGGSGGYGWNVAAAVDGQFLEVAGPDTVYDLTPTPPGQIAPGIAPGNIRATPAPFPGAGAGPDSANAIDARINARIDSRVPAQVNARVEAQVK